MKTHILSLIVCFALSISANLKAQDSGNISGTVVDAESGETLIGVNVVIEGTTKGTSSDLDGNYSIRNVETGTYTLIVSYVSFQRQVITGVEVSIGETLKLDITLQQETETLEDVIVTAEAILNNEAGLLRHRQKSISFSDAISAENISNAGAGNAAAAMTKVTGASVVDGKYIFIRGLGDRYTSTQLNGLELPTADPDKKSFQLDLFPSNLLENIVTLKTFTPDKPGNFSGGLVDIKTKGIPEGFFFSVSAKQGFNESASQKNILLGEKNSSDWIGYDNGYRDAPDIVEGRSNEDFPNDVEARFSPEAAEELDEIAKSFNTSFLPEYSQAGLNQSYSIGIGNRHDFSENVKLGYSLSYSYGMNYSAYENGRNSRYELLGQYEDTNSLSPNLDLVDSKGTQSVDAGLLGSVGLILGNSNRINFSYLNTQSGENSGRYLHGFWEQFNSDDIEYRSRVNQYTERNLSSYQLSGKHTFQELNNLQVHWKTAIQQNGQEEPDLRFIASEARYLYDENHSPIDTLYGNSRSQFPRPARLFRELNESKFSGTLDVTIPVDLFTQTLALKVGALYEATDRSFAERRYEYLQGRNFDLNQLESEEAFLNQTGIIGYDNADRPMVGNYIVSATTNRSSYDANQGINAFYGMVDIDIFEKLKLATGFRYEITDLETISRDSTLSDGDRFGRIDQSDLLPSILLIYSINDNMNFRAAATKTLARPTFRELAPYVSFDFVGDNLFRGNANLERTLITNYDVRWEFYPSPTEVFSLSAFYKNIENPIERVLRFDIAEKAESVQNVEKGRVAGIEVEARKNLGSFADFLSPFQLTANVTYVESEVNIPEQELIQVRQTQDNPELTRSLTGQSPYLVNLDLSYLNPKAGINSNVSFNNFGDRLSKITLGSAPNIYERSYSTLNYNITKAFGKHFSLSFSASNLLNPDVTYSQIFKGEEYIYQQYKTGRSFSFGVKYDF
ncbi:MAG: TonB-dependent receptor [Balneolaceae bacterium]